MGVTAHPFVVSLKGRVQVNEEMCNSSESLLNKVSEAQAKKTCQVRKQRLTRKNVGRVKDKTPRRIWMKRRARLEGSRRAANGIDKRVRTLKKLVPNSESMGLDGLFRETADYISSLQLRVKVMQIMVKVLTGSDD